MKTNQGYIVVSNSLFSDGDIRAEIFRHIIPHSIQPDLVVHDAVRIYGFCEHFKELKEGYQIPQYELTMKETALGLTVIGIE